MLIILPILSLPTWSYQDSLTKMSHTAHLHTGIKHGAQDYVEKHW
jgi:hypothetical protein